MANNYGHALLTRGKAEVYSLVCTVDCYRHCKPSLHLFCLQALWNVCLFEPFASSGPSHAQYVFTDRVGGNDK